MVNFPSLSLSLDSALASREFDWIVFTILEVSIDGLRLKVYRSDEPPTSYLEYTLLGEILILDMPPAR